MELNIEGKLVQIISKDPAQEIYTLANGAIVRVQGDVSTEVKKIIEWIKEAETDLLPKLKPFSNDVTNIFSNIEPDIDSKVNSGIITKIENEVSKLGTELADELKSIEGKVEGIFKKKK